jgi:hypothetical protein
LAVRGGRARFARSLAHFPSLKQNSEQKIFKGVCSIFSRLCELTLAPRSRFVHLKLALLGTARSTERLFALHSVILLLFIFLKYNLNITHMQRERESRERAVMTTGLPPRHIIYSHLDVGLIMALAAAGMYTG